MKQKKSLTLNAAFNVMYRMLNVVFPLISVAYISRVLEPAGVGKVADAQNFVSYFVLLAALGTPRYGTRAISQNRGDPEKINRLFSELFCINAISTAVCSAAFIMLIMILAPAEPLIYLVCGVEILFNLINIDWLYEGEEEYVYITVRSVVIKLVSLIALFLFVKDRQDYVAYAAVHCIGTCGNHIFNIIHAQKKVKLTFRGLNLKPHIKPILVLAVSAVIGSIYSKVNVTLLGQLQSDENVGFYTNAHKMVTLGVTLVTAISAVFLPRLSYVYKKSKEEFSEFVTKGTKILLLLAVPCAVGIALVAGDLVQVVFGELFMPSVLCLQIMTPIIVIMGIGDLLCYQTIISSENEKLLVMSRILAGVISIALNLLLIPRLQHNGAAIATLTCELAVNGVLLPKALSIASVKLNAKFILSIIASTVVMAAVVLLVQHLCSHAFVALVLAVLGGVVAYVAMAVLTKNELVAYVIDVVKQKTKKK